MRKHRVRAVLATSVALVAITLPARAEELTESASMLSPVVPAYPQQARRQGIEGKVVLRVHVLADGRPGQVEVQQSSRSADLDAAAVQAVQRSGFRAALGASGNPVDSWVVVPYRFVLQ